MATAQKQEVIEIKQLDIQRTNIRIIGDTPLIVHAWSEKAKNMMLATQTKKTKTKAKDVRDPLDDFIQSLYWLEGKPEKSTPEAFSKAVEGGAKWGFPVGAIKQAANSAAYRLGWVKNQMELRGSYFIESDFGEMAEIKGAIPKMRQDMVRIGMGSADLRYRGEFKDWYMDLTVAYNASGNLTLEQILNVINAGGYATGLGEWRPEKDGNNGRFHIETIN